MQNTGMRNGAARGGIQSVLGKLSGKVIDFASLLVLAQMLLPEDFGLVAIAMSVVLLTEAVTELPLIQPLLREETVTDDYFDTSFTLGLLRAAVLFAGITLSAASIANLYGDERLEALLIALMWAPIARGLISPRMALFVRNYNLGPDMIMNIVGKLGAFSFVVFAASLTKSYWAIAIGTISGPLIMVIVSYCYAPYRPRLSLSRWSKFSDVVGWNSVQQILSAVNFQIDRLLLGGVLSKGAMGQYALSSDLVNVVFQGILWPLNSIRIVQISRAEREAKTQEAWISILNVSLALVGPFFLGLIIAPDLIVQILLGEDWHGTGPILAAISFTSFPAIMNIALPALAIALYKPKLIAVRAFIDLVVRLPTMCIGIFFFGLWGAIFARGVANIVSALVAFHAAKQLVGVSVLAQLWSLRRTVVSLGVFSLVFFGLSSLISVEDSLGIRRIGSGVFLLLYFVLAIAAQITSSVGLWHLSGRPQSGADEAIWGFFSKRFLGRFRR